MLGGLIFSCWLDLILEDNNSTNALALLRSDISNAVVVLFWAINVCCRKR